MIGKRTYLRGLVLLLLLFALAAGFAGAARAPWWDEAAFADSAYNLAFHGKFGSTTWLPLLPMHPDFPHMNQYTFWMPPLYSVTLAGWFAAFGFSILSMHLYSLIWGVVLVTAVYVLVVSMLGQEQPTLFAAVLTAVNSSVLYSSSTGRPDVMSAALGTAALAAYTALRNRDFSLSIIISWLFGALALLSHPLGLIHISVLLIAIVLLDRKRIRPVHLLYAAAPVCFVMLGWGLYIAKSPEVFKAQFLLHVGGRVNNGIFAPVKGLYPEVKIRYVDYFSGYPPGWMRVRLLIPITYLITYIILLFSGFWRRNEAARLMVVISPVAFLSLSVIDGARFSHYLVHVFPIYSAMAVVTLWNVFQIEAPSITRRLGLVIAGLFCVAIVLQAGMAVYKTRDFERKREYDSMAKLIESTASKDVVILGSAELMFGLGRDYKLIDDPRLGFYSGVQPGFIILGPFRPVNSFFEPGERYILPYIKDLLENRAELISRNQLYTFYRVKTVARDKEILPGFKFRSGTGQ
jgi:4-amino-4-deoxy-L-arabinose transferase-like glycosyltransferase